MVKFLRIHEYVFIFNGFSVPSRGALGIPYPQVVNGRLYVGKALPSTLFPLCLKTHAPNAVSHMTGGENLARNTHR